MERGIRKDTQKFFRIAEVAKRWRVSESTIRRMVANKKLNVTWFGGSVRISIDEIRRHESNE
jgi:excisionase family DNA binding protein